MCGRYGLTFDQEALSAAYAVELFLTDHPPRYNSTPSQDMLVLCGGPGGRWMKKIGIVAVARKLLTKPWRYLGTGAVPQEAELRV